MHLPATRCVVDVESRRPISAEELRKQMRRFLKREELSEELAAEIEQISTALTPSESRKYCMNCAVLFQNLPPLRMLWVDKYRPDSFESLTVHAGLNECLQSLTKADDMPHILLVGPSGAGKMTRVRALLRELYGPGAGKMKMEDKVFVTPSSRKVEMAVFGSAYHVEMCPADVGVYDRVVVQEIIKDLAQSPPLDKTKHSFKIVVILDADRLSKDAQHALRRTMEKYSRNLRLIMCCASSSRIISPIRSRCTVLRVPAPSDAEIQQILSKVAVAEGIKNPNPIVQSSVAIACGNVRRALLAFESACAKGVTYAEKPDWESCLLAIADQIFKDQSPTSLLTIRGIFYDLLTHNIPATLIFEALTPMLLSRAAKPDMCWQITEAAAFYDHRSARGTKDIFHLEAFAARVMSNIAASR